MVDDEPRPEVLERYQRFVQDNHGEIDPLRLATVMWNAGGREMVGTMTQFSDVLAIAHRLEQKANRIVELLESVVHDRRAFDWSMSNAMTEERAIAHPDGDQELEELPF